MSLSEDQSKLIREAIEAGKRANQQALGRVTLPLRGKRYVVLANRDGPTAAGKLYKQILGDASGTQGFAADPIVRLNGGNREFLQIRGQKRKLLRYVDGSGEDWKYTREGTK